MTKLSTVELLSQNEKLKSNPRFIMLVQTRCGCGCDRANLLYIFQ